MKTEYNLEVDNIIELIENEKYNLVCLQLPDGLKPLAGEIKDKIEKKIKAKVIIYAGSCWGACDIPTGLDKLGVDLLVHFGHAPFKRPW